MCSSCEKIFNIDATETESIVFMSMAYHDNKYIIFEVIETNVAVFQLGVNNTFVVFFPAIRYFMQMPFSKISAIKGSSFDSCKIYLYCSPCFQVDHVYR